MKGNSKTSDESCFKSYRRIQLISSATWKIERTSLLAPVLHVRNELTHHREGN